MKRRNLLAYTLLSCLAVAALARAGEVTADFGRAERYFYDKDYVSAARLYRDILEREPGGPFAAAAGLRIGMCDFALGEYAAAARVLAKFEEGFPRSPYLDDATFLAAQAFFRMGEYHRSLERLLRVVSFGEKSRYYDRAVRGLGNLADEALTAEHLRKRLEDYYHSPEAAAVLLKLAKHEMTRGDYAKAVVILDEVATSYGDIAAGKEAAELIAGVREKLGREPYAVGALLPLSGEYEVYGAVMRAGIELALEEYNGAHAAEPVTVVFEDTGGTADGAVDAAGRLIYAARVIAVIGPALTANVRAAAPLFSTNEVPALSPAATDGTLARLNGFIYLNGLTRQAETRAMAAYATGHLGLKKFAVLYPANAYGAELRDAFEDAVKAQGGEVAGAVEYPLIDMTLEPDKREVNYSPFTKQLKWLRPDAVYIPGHYTEIVRLLPQLTFSDVSAYVLGANGWNENRVIRVGSKYVEGAYFTAGLFADAPAPAVRNFVANYRRRTAEFPNYLAAQAYDAANIIFGVLSPPAQSGAEVKERLDAVVDYAGITGLTTLRGDDGLPDKKITILTVHEGEAVEAP